MNIDRSVRKLDRLFAKRAKIEYNLAAVSGQIVEVQDRIEKERNILQSKLDVIDKTPRKTTLAESVEHMTAKKDIELAADAAKITVKK